MKCWEPNRTGKSGTILCAVLLVSTALVSAQSADTLGTSPNRSRSKAVSVFLAPTLLISAGLASMNDRGLYSSYDAYECVQSKHPDFHTTADDYLMLVPAAAVYGLNWAGVKGKHKFVDRSLIYLSSLSLALATSTLIKNTTDVLRPDESDYKSMPSNHTAIAFASATFLFEEYREESIWYGVAGYTVATATGVLRILNNKHWMSDVLVGAGLGILATECVYWVYPLIKDCLSKNSGKTSWNKLTMIPYLSGRNYGLSLTYQIQPFRSL
jgi:membrane-associated phospholipid phosphatase